MNAFFKTQPLRNQKLRDFAKDAPYCFGCLENVEAGSIVMAHPNGYEFGKGLGLKGFDLPAYVCQKCHKIIDQYIGGKEASMLLWLKACVRSVKWLLETKRLQTNDTIGKLRDL